MTHHHNDNLRVVLYSHDTMGLGHVRRNLLIAQALTQSPLRATVLLVSGIREAGQFALPAGVDLLCLPSVCKSAHATYATRQLQMPIESVARMRSHIIRASIEAFGPHVLVSDKVPRGLHGELEPTLTMLRQQGGTQCILGLRDILDDPTTARAEWHGNGNEEFIRDHYDSIWIYGDRTIYDTPEVCRFAADLRAKTTFVGYLDQRRRLDLWPQAPVTHTWQQLTDQPFVLCVVGGGQDGSALARAFVSAELPAGRRGVLVTGPYLPRDLSHEIRRIAGTRADMHVVDFCPESDYLLSRADRVISMGGYNSVCSILSHGKTGLVIPRVWPRREQYMRAKRLRGLGLLSMLHPSQVTAGSLSDWLDAEIPPPRSLEPYNFSGLESIQSFLFHSPSVAFNSRTVAC